MGISYGSLDFKNPRVQAKLVASRELLASRNNALVAHARPGELQKHPLYWLVELRATNGTLSSYTWTLVAIDANSGAVVTAFGGPNIGPNGVSDRADSPYWEDLPDHSAACPSHGISAAFILPRDTMAEGSSMTGDLVIDNETGAPISAGCSPGDFAVALANDQVHPAIAFTMPGCIHTRTTMIPIGMSHRPLTLKAENYSSCLPQDEPSTSSPVYPPPTYPATVPATPPARCVLPYDGRLPPGDYHTEFFTTVEALHAAPVTVHIVAARTGGATP
jgi:hypothetical protein